MNERGITGYIKTGIKTAVDATLDVIIGSIDNLSFSPKLKRRNSDKIDVFRRAFKYESLVFHGWRSVWCTYITIVAFYNFQRMRAEFDTKYGNQDNIPYHTHYDRKTSWDILLAMGFFLVDLLIYVIRRKFMTRDVLIHHIVGLILCGIAVMSKYPHHYHANLFMCTEVVSCLTVMAHYAKKSRSKTLYKLYLLQYLLLTIFGRGWIWYTIGKDLIANSVGYVCYFGILPLLIMDVVWSRQCVRGILK